MHTTLRALALSLLLIAGPALAAGKSAGRVPRGTDGWPATPAGTLGRRYVAAFNRGDDAMRAFYADAIAPESLAVRPVEKRIARYRDLRERYGRLAFASVVKDSAEMLVVSLLDADAAAHEFVFTVQPAAPRKLVTIAVREMRNVGHFGGFHH